MRLQYISTTGAGDIRLNKFKKKRFNLVKLVPQLYLPRSGLCPPLLKAAADDDDAIT